MPFLPLGAVVVRRAPLPSWLMAAPVVVAGLVGGTHASRVGADVVLVALLAAGWITGGAVVGSLIRAGEPGTPWWRVRAVPFVVSSLALYVCAWFGVSSPDQLPLWIMSAAAIACRAGGGATAEATARDVATGVVILAFLALLFPRFPVDRVPDVVARAGLLAHAALTRWAVGGTPWERWWWAIGVIPGLLRIVAANAPAVAVEIGARASGTWDDLPVVSASHPLDCTPTTTPGRMRGCRWGASVWWGPMDAPAEGVGSVVGRTGVPWPPSQRVVVYDMLIPSSLDGRPVVTLVGPDRLRIGGEERPSSALAALRFSGSVPFVVVEGGTVGDLLALCGPTTPCLQEEPAVARPAPSSFYDQASKLQIACAGLLIAAWIGAMVRARGAPTSGLWAAGAVGLAAVGVSTAGASHVWGVAIGAAIGAGIALGSVDRPMRALGVGGALTAGVVAAGTAWTPEFRELSVAFGVHAFGALALVGAGRPKLQVALAAAHVVPLGVLTAALGAVLVLDDGRAVGAPRLMLGAALQYGVVSAVAGVAAARTRRWGWLAALAVAPAAVMSAALVLVVPTATQRALVRFEPLPTGPAEVLHVDARCARTAQGLVRVPGGAPCTAGQGWVLPAGIALDAAVLREDLGAIAMRREGRLGAVGWRQVDLLQPADPPMRGEVSFVHGMSVEALLAQCGDAPLCWVRLPP